jgi:hypothetical protein
MDEELLTLMQSQEIHDLCVHLPICLNFLYRLKHSQLPLINALSCLWIVLYLSERQVVDFFQSWQQTANITFQGVIPIGYEGVVVELQMLQCAISVIAECSENRYDALELVK